MERRGWRGGRAVFGLLRHRVVGRFEARSRIVSAGKHGPAANCAGGSLVLQLEEEGHSVLRELQPLGLGLPHRRIWRLLSVPLSAHEGDSKEAGIADLNIPLRPLQQRYSFFDVLGSDGSVLLQGSLLRFRQLADVDVGGGHCCRRGEVTRWCVNLNEHFRPRGDGLRKENECRWC